MTTVETRNIQVMGLGAAYIRDFTVSTILSIHGDQQCGRVDYHIRGKRENGLTGLNYYLLATQKSHRRSNSRFTHQSLGTDLSFCIGKYRYYFTIVSLDCFTCIGCRFIMLNTENVLLGSRPPLIHTMTSIVANKQPLSSRHHEVIISQRNQ